MSLRRCIDSHTKFSGGRCEATAYRLAENDRIWLSLDGDFGRPRVSWTTLSSLGPTELQAREYDLDFVGSGYEPG
jgi:hypothetical protein